MKSWRISKFSRSKKYQILCALKRRGALSVPNLLNCISLSYMGIKQHCIELERDGYLVKRRKPKTSGRGRPEQMYELTDAADEVFPSHGTFLTGRIMFALRQLYGASAPEKVLFVIYQEIMERYRNGMSSMPMEEKLRDFLRLREKDGYLLDLNRPRDGTEWMVTECHSPIAGFLEEFPILLNFELQIYQKTLHPHAKRIQHSAQPYRMVYGIPKN